jgi:hypothetical protein
MAATEFYTVSYDSISGVIFGGAQDNGTDQQTGPGSSVWMSAHGGDGRGTAVDNTGPNSIHYLMNDSIKALSRQTYAPGNILVADQPLLLASPQTPTVQYSGLSANDKAGGTKGRVPFAVNTVVPTRFLLGDQGLYESFDRGDTITDIAPFEDNGAVTALVYGGHSQGTANPDLIYFGDQDGNVYLRTAANQPVHQLTSFPGAAGTAIMAIATDPNDWRIAYVVNSASQVYRTNDAGTTWSEVTGNLLNLAFKVRTILVYAPTTNPADDVVLLGGLGGPLGVGGVFAAINPSAGSSTTWAHFGIGLPNVQVTDLQYDPKADLLLAATFGRGAWTVSHFSAIVAVPSSVQFGATDFVAASTASFAAVTVTRTGNINQAASVDFATIPGGTATPGVDYFPISGTLTFAPGEASRQIQIPLLSSTRFGAQPTVLLSLTNPGTNTALGAITTAVLTIDQPTPVQVANLNLVAPRRLAPFVSLAFTGPIASQAAVNVAHYLVMSSGRDGVFGTPDDRIIRVVTAAINPASNVLTLTLPRRTPRAQPLEVMLVGLTGANTAPVEGFANPTFFLGRTIRIRDITGTLTTVRLGGGGWMQVTYAPNGTAQIVQLHSVNATPVVTQTSLTRVPHGPSARSVQFHHRIHGR